jgi:hypothetical protein
VKKGTHNHHKMHDLAAILGIRRSQAVGMMQMLWEYAGEFTPRGDIGKAQKRHIARAMDWDGDPDVLINALVDSGWLDLDEEYGLIIHDWPDHCDKWVKDRLKRLRIEFLPAYKRRLLNERPPSDRRATTERPPSDCRATAERPPSDHRATTERPPSDCRATTERPPSDHLADAAHRTRSEGGGEGLVREGLDREGLSGKEEGYGEKPETPVEAVFVDAGLACAPSARDPADPAAILEELKLIYLRAGVPVAPRHEQMAVQYLVDIPPPRRHRVVDYVKNCLLTGRWRNARTTKSLLNLLRDGDWDVPLVARTLPDPPGEDSPERRVEQRRRLLERRRETHGVAG